MTMFPDGHQPDHVSDERLSALLSGDLSPVERTQLDRHLAACPACRAALAGLRATVELLRSQPEPRPRRSFQLAPGQVALPGFWSRLADRLLPALPALRAATVAVALLLTGVVAADRLTNDRAPDRAPINAGQIAQVTRPAQSERAAAAPTPTSLPVATVAPSFKSSTGDSSESGQTGAIAAESSSATAPSAAFSAAAPDAAAAERQPAGGEENDSAEVPPAAAGAGAPSAKAPADELAQTGPEESALLAASPTPTASPVASPAPVAPTVNSGIADRGAWRGWRIGEVGLLVVLLCLGAVVITLHQMRKRRVLSAGTKSAP